MGFHVVIPARLASTRLASKPLLDIHGKPMIQWVYENALKSNAESVIIATDDQSIVEVVNSFNGNVSLTRADHSNGTDRIVEVCEQQQWSDDTVIVNCQGDEPLMPFENLNQVAQLLNKYKAPMSTLHKSISATQAANPNQVKLVCAEDGKALYFSRSIMPFDRDGDQSIDYYGHIGLYAYQVGFLKTYSTLAPCSLETIEKLEQLRALYYGYNIYSQLAVKEPGTGVDTQQDLDEVRKIIQGM
ncbi:MAG: 3-deoxy-manno-octulosonate cytidylyltransferase [Gammaproteobacteria bacterium]|nr:3-deoxy-manno-octulosonate cytidylyltransferase [Gammaproteobacteria bacterium]